MTPIICCLYSSPPTLGAEVSSIKNAAVEFRISSPDLKNIGGARVIIINNKGAIIANGVTNSSGVWSSFLHTEQDPRFVNIHQLGTVTAIVTAVGYNEEVVFEVPVFPGSIQPVTMVPLRPSQRNEPINDLGNLHRHDIRQMIDRYANELGLAKQKPLPGERDDDHWSPELKPTR